MWRNWSENLNSQVCCKHLASVVLPRLALITVNRLEGLVMRRALLQLIFVVYLLLFTVCSLEILSPYNAGDRIHNLAYIRQILLSYINNLPYTPTEVRLLLPQNWKTFEGQKSLPAVVWFLQLPDSDVKINLNYSLNSPANSEEHSILPLAALIHVKLFVQGSKPSSSAAKPHIQSICDISTLNLPSFSLFRYSIHILFSYFTCAVGSHFFSLYKVLAYFRTFSYTYITVSIFLPHVLVPISPPPTLTPISPFDSHR